LSKDPQYDRPFVDVDEWRDEPARHRYVHGGFEGTDLRFSYYFPPPDRYEGRFFQPILAMSGTEHAFGSGMLAGMGASIDFALDSGAYMVESNLGRLNPFPGDDPTVTGFRASAAAAQHSRVVAAEMYGPHRPHGYVFGGSGGGFKTISCIESTRGVWDGAVPFILGSPQSLPNVFSVQAHALRILWHKFPQINDAIAPGGCGDMYAGLSAEEREALAEVTRMGFPPRAWFNYERIANGYTGVWSVLGDNMLTYDPEYFEDFWTVPGYLGANPTESLLAARVQHKTSVVRPILEAEAKELGLPLAMAIARTESMADVPVALRVQGLPDAVLGGAMLTVTSGVAAGRNLWVVNVVDDIVITGVGEAHFEGLAGIVAGDEVLIDNSVYLAFQTYHRHQVHPDYRVWDQFCVNGQPVYPQRPNLIGARFALPGSGSIESGRFAGRMILVESLMDEAAYPWQAAQYHRMVEEALGDRTDDQFRLWFVDHAMHLPPSVEPGDARPVRTTQIVSYRGVLEQALRDVADWVEQGVAPPASDRYEEADGQVLLPALAAERKGIQPTVALTVDGRDRIDVAVGDTVDFTALAVVPPGTGTITGAEWDFDGSGDYGLQDSSLDGSLDRVNLTASHTFTEPGTYFPALRVTAQRRGGTGDPHGRIQNLGRVRVVVG
jgi:hypothetical protein